MQYYFPRKLAMKPLDLDDVLRRYNRNSELEIIIAEPGERLSRDGFVRILKHFAITGRVSPETYTVIGGVDRTRRCIKTADETYHERKTLIRGARGCIGNAAIRIKLSTEHPARPHLFVPGEYRATKTRFSQQIDDNWRLDASFIWPDSGEHVPLFDVADIENIIAAMPADMLYSIELEFVGEPFRLKTAVADAFEWIAAIEL